MNIIRKYNQNRKLVWEIILIIIFVIVILQILNYLSSKKGEESANNVTNSVGIVEGTTKATSNTSGVTGENLSKTQLNKAEEIFEEFFGYCNKKDLQNAYDMLTDECKEQIYPKIEDFESNYYNNIFNNETKTYTYENWYGNTYMVKIGANSLATGKVDNNKKQDYMTIVDGKLNISAYIGRTEINKTTKSNGMECEVISKDTYMEYEIYNIKMTNNSENKICLDTAEKSKNVYIQDESEVEYGVYNHELTQKQLVIQKGYTSNLSLKFYSNYVSTKKIKKLVFSNVILNYENYTNDKDNYNEYKKINIEL